VQTLYLGLCFYFPFSNNEILLIFTLHGVEMSYDIFWEFCCEMSHQLHLTSLITVAVLCMRTLVVFISASSTHKPYTGLSMKVTFGCADRTLAEEEGRTTVVGG
jgi:lysylphosphatidylglycerol synthetase-like protein (DUF2156 family)